VGLRHLLPRARRRGRRNVAHCQLREFGTPSAATRDQLSVWLVAGKNAQRMPSGSMVCKGVEGRPKLKIFATVEVDAA
jgi:hypothetical protein